MAEAAGRTELMQEVKAFKSSVSEELAELRDGRITDQVRHARVCHRRAPGASPQSLSAGPRLRSAGAQPLGANGCRVRTDAERWRGATQAEVRTLRQELALTAALPEMVATLSEQVRRLAAKLEELAPDGETPENPLLDAVNVLAKRVAGVERSQAVTDEKVDHAVYQVSGQTLVHSYGWPRPGPQAVG
jgi:hypothetical protein